MKTLPATTASPLPVPNAEQRVLDACAACATAEADYATKAVIAGFLLLEYRVALADPCDLSYLSDAADKPSTSHRGKSSLIHGRNQHYKGDQFLAWLDFHGIAKSSAYRWMNAAERIARHQLGIPMADDFTPFIDIGGKSVPMSQALLADPTAPPDASDALRTFAQGIFGFMADKTLSQAARAAIDDESSANRITRAANGKAGGTRGEDRKDFPLFAGKCLADCLHHIGASVDKKGGHWKALTAVGKQQASQYIGLFLQGLPIELVEYISAGITLELQKRRKGHQPQPLALKAAVDKDLGDKALAAAH